MPPARPVVPTRDGGPRAVACPRAAAPARVAACRAARAGALAGALGLAAAGCAPDTAAAFPDANLLIISIDTLRADGLSTHGGPPGISPALEEFARHGVVFRHARAQAPHTAPSHMSLFTSRFPSEHGVLNGGQPGDGEGPVVAELPREIPTLAELLQRAGFTSVGLTGGGNVGPAHGFGRGFDAYGTGKLAVEDLVDDGLNWVGRLRRQAAGRHFLFVHTYEVHAPYVPPDDVLARWTPSGYVGVMRPVVDQMRNQTDELKWRFWHNVFARLEAQLGPEDARYMRGLYNGEVHHTDRALARLFEGLDAEGAWDDTIVVVLSDHGEEFLEHGGWQHMQLYEECLRVPLIVRLPGDRGAGLAFDTPVALIDLAPTLLELLGVPADDVVMRGRSLAPSILAGREPEARPITSELRWHQPHKGADWWQVAHHHGGLKLIHDELASRAQGRPVRKLFDLARDPGERDDLLLRDGPGAAGDGLLHLDALHAEWSRRVAAAAAGLHPTERRLSPEEAERLAELGYVDAGDDGR